MRLYTIHIAFRGESRHTGIVAARCRCAKYGLWVPIPQSCDVDAVQAFEATFPTVQIRRHEEALSAVAQLVRHYGAMIGVGGGLFDVEPDLELIHIGDVEMIGPEHERYIAASNALVPGGFTSFIDWARAHMKVI